MHSVVLTCAHVVVFYLEPEISSLCVPCESETPRPGSDFPL